MTPTIDHVYQPEPGACLCKPWRICPSCALDLQRLRYDLELRDWLDLWGNVPDPKAPHRRGAGLGLVAARIWLC